MKRFLPILLVFSMLLGTLAGCKKQPDDPGDGTTTGSGTTSGATTGATTGEDPATTPSADPTTNPGQTVEQVEEPESVTVGNIRVQLLSDTLVRLEIKGPKGFEDRPSYHVTKRTGWDKVAYTTEAADGYTVITTDAYKVYIPNDAKNLVNAYITDKENEELWRYELNTTGSVYMPSPSDELASWYFTDAPRVIPSENGYSVMDSYEAYNGWDLSNDAIDTFVFLPQGQYKNFTSDFVKLTGSSELITLKMLGYWDSRWYAYTSETALAQIQDYLDRGYSIDVLVIDTDWRSAEAGTGYEVNKKLFPDMADFLKKAHEMGVSIVFNDHPEPEKGTNNLLDEKEVEFRNNNLKLILSLGLDYWWYDRNWSVSLKPIDNDISIYASGMYAFQWITEDYYNSITDINEYARRALIMANVDGIWNGTMTNPSDLSAHRFTLQWTGDIGTGVRELEKEIFNAIYGSNVMGIPYVSADIGGHVSEVSPDMYVRWIQFGALSPIMRVHCTRPFSRMPWLYGETAEAVTHTYVNMRYRLLPLYYALAHENYETGLPLLKRLDILYPQYAEANANDEYLLGDTILVAPLAESYAKDEETYFTANGRKGLYGEYFSNVNFSGTPTATRYDENIYFDYVLGGPDLLTVVDNFSIRWTGNIVVGSSDCILRFHADDGIRVWIDDKLVIDGWDVYDTYLTTDPIPANTTHKIRIDFFEAGHNSHIYTSIYTNSGVSRDVFIPDGEWMDVWTGETFVGPATITVKHKLDTSPIFVRMGTVLALADNMSNVDEKDWSHLTLDVYPSTSYKSSTTVYEDDTQTVAYKDGKYRKTEITMEGSGNNVTLVVNPAVGTFEGAKAFTKRDWTVRVHGRSDWGALKSVTVDGKNVNFTTVAKDAKAEPFAITGGVRDGVIYEFTFSADVTAKSTIVLTFDSAKADRTNTDYDKSATDFKVEIEKQAKSNTAPNLSAFGNKDWAIFGTLATDTVIRKNVKNHLIGELTHLGEIKTFSDNFKISWQDGDLLPVYSTTNGVFSGVGFEMTLKAGPDKTHYQLYVGGYKSIGKLTVRDRAGNVKTYTFGDMGTNYYRLVSIDCQSEKETEIYITYTMLSGENVTLAAVTASDGNVEELQPVDPTPAQSIVKVDTPYTDVFDLTKEGTKYWEYYGQSVQSKAGSTDIIDTTFDGGGQTHDDNKAPVKWTDGAATASDQTTVGRNGGGATVKINTAGCKEVKLLVGAWNASNVLTIYDENSIPVESVTVVTAGGDAQLAVVTIDLTKYEGQSITLRFAAEQSNGGNISLTAVTVK